MGSKSNREFYETIDRAQLYTPENDACDHPFYNMLVAFIKKWDLTDRKCLEVGSGKGLFQDIVADYTGADIAESLRGYYHKPYVAVSGAKLPFPDEHFDVIFTYATHEHMPDIEKGLEEIVRILKPGGICLFAPAWHTRTWFPMGYMVRSYSELDLKGRFIKFSIPFRDFILVRWPIVLFRRIIRLILYVLTSSKPAPLCYKKLKTNYEVYYHSDSDACNSLDPFDVILWFKSRGFRCHGYQSIASWLFVRTNALELEKPQCT